MVKKTFIILAVFVLIMFMPFCAFAEIVYLKSGKKIEGSITEKTQEYIKINVSGVDLIFFVDELERIESVQNIEPQELIFDYKKVLNSLPAQFWIRYKRILLGPQADNISEADVYVYKSGEKILIKEIFSLAEESTVASENILIYDGEDTIYIIDSEERTGEQYSINELYSSMHTSEGGYNNLVQSILGLALLGFDIVQDVGEDLSEYVLERVLYKDCVVVESNNQKKWVWSNIPFQVETKLKLRNKSYIDKITAVDFKTVIDFSDYDFIPSGDIDFKRLESSDLRQRLKSFKAEDYESFTLYDIHMAKILNDLNEAYAIDSFRKLLFALSGYIGVSRRHKFPEQLSDLSKHVEIDKDLALGYKNGYIFKYKPILDEFGNRNNFEIIARPWVQDGTGRRSFFMNDSGVLREGVDLDGKVIGHLRR